MLLSNLTADAAACTLLLNLEIPVLPHPSASPPFYPYHSRCATSPSPTDVQSRDPINVPALPLLLQAFVQGAHIDTTDESMARTRKGDLHFLATVFANLSVVRQPCSQLDHRAYSLTFLHPIIKDRTRANVLPHTTACRCPTNRHERKI